MPTWPRPNSRVTKGHFASKGLSWNTLRQLGLSRLIFATRKMAESRQTGRCRETLKFCDKAGNAQSLQASNPNDPW